MNTPTPNDKNKDTSSRSTSRRDATPQHIGTAISGTLTPQSRQDHAAELLAKLFQHESISDPDYQALAGQVLTPGSSGSQLRSDTFKYILRSEDNFLQFVDVRKPLPLGLQELTKVDTYIATELAPTLSPEQRLNWFRRIVSHLAHLGNYPTWDSTHLEQLQHATSTLSRLRTTELLLSHADTHTRDAFQDALASVFTRASANCTDISLYPALYEALKDLLILPASLLSTRCKGSINSLYTALRGFLPAARRSVIDEDQPTSFIGESPYAPEDWTDSFHEDAPSSGWEIDLPKSILDQILDESMGADLTEDNLQRISEAQFAFSAMTRLSIQVSTTLASLSDLSDLSYMKDLCYEHSFYEPEWLHYVRGLARADQKGAVLIDVVADLLLVAAGDTQAMQQLVGLIAADLLLEEPSNQLVLRSLREARHTLNDELRLKIRNRLWTAYLGNADKTTDIAGVPIDKTLFFEATKQILAQVYPEEIVVQKKRP